MMNPSASQDLWQSPGYRRGPPSVRRLPGLCTSTIDDHSRLDSCSRSLIAKHQLLHATRQLQARSQSPRLLIGSLAGLVPAETGPEPTARA